MPLDVFHATPVALHVLARQRVPFTFAVAAWVFCRISRVGSRRRFLGGPVYDGRAGAITIT